jgi:DNA invertase Pin-like site-specific DNA recombinase
MMAEQERMESKRRQQQGIALAKAKGHYRGRPVDYSPVSRD